MRVGLVHWWPKDELREGLERLLVRLGHTVVEIRWNGPLPDCDVALVHGPFGSLTPLASQSLARAPSRRPALALLLTEQLPDPRLPEALRLAGGWLRSGFDRLALRPNATGEWRTPGSLRALLMTGLRFRYYGDLHWLRRHGMLDAFAVWSRWTASFLTDRGFEPAVLSSMLGADLGSDLGLARDVPVLWLGKTGTARRARRLADLRAALARRGVEILVVDGVEHPYVFGAERTALLNRTKIALNLLREPWDDNSMRYALAARNGALVVTEPTLPHSAFRPGEHIVEAPLAELADTICFYLENDAARARIVERAGALVRQEADLGPGISDLLERAVRQLSLGAGVERADRDEVAA